MLWAFGRGLQTQGFFLLRFPQMDLIKVCRWSLCVVALWLRHSHQADSVHQVYQDMWGDPERASTLEDELNRLVRPFLMPIVGAMVMNPLMIALQVRTGCLG
jgi:hypothetical protein